MRLICPNCGAQYEIADDVIPQAGRDVQCSNCGHTWFEKPGASADLADDEANDGQHHLTEDEGESDEDTDIADEPAEEDPAAAFFAGTEDDDDDPVPATGHHHTVEETPVDDPEPQQADADDDVPTDPEPPAEPAWTEPAAEPSEPDWHEPETTAAEEPTPEPEPVAPPAPPPPPAPQRAALDTSIADILREEAAREEAARKAEMGGGLESQGDLGLDGATAVDEQRKREAADRIARLRGEETAAAVAAAAAASRRELLPDIEEINSTLRSSAERGEVPPPLPHEAEAIERRGFRFGFFGMLLIFAGLIAIYVLADTIRTAVPALDGALTSYVALVDNLRLWLDGQLKGILAGLEQGDAATDGAAPANGTDPAPATAPDTSTATPPEPTEPAADGN